ncbi:unnamed protein product [Phaedon cochleariae]|uniref:Transmembrane protein 33 n=1 Tax=Phaedon cochleariae TaxID=80249 RepID=A0A9N9SEK6_PHACE|nr:unnamed protein product [Phaedon cochleariae]
MGDSGDAQTSTGEPRPSRGLNFEALKLHVLTHKIDCGLWAIRILAILFAIGYFIPIFGNAQSAYYKVLIANAAISALRLHQRLGRVTFTREFLAQLLTEDSCHYLFYSLIFLYVAPLSSLFIRSDPFRGRASQLTPFYYQFLTQRYASRRNPYTPNMFCELHILLESTMGRASLLTPFIYYQFLTQRYVSRRNPYTPNMFRELHILFESTMGRASQLTPFIYYQFLTQRYASRRNPYTPNMFCELHILFESTMGRASLLTPFIYYQFLTQRYASRRNPYTRNMFRELRILCENTAAKPSVPAVVKRALLAGVAFTCRLAPAQVVPGQQQ